MPKAVFHGTVIAESQETEMVEGNHYFPPASVKQEYLQPSETHSLCPWKGTASYYNVVVDQNVGKDAAWFCPEAKDAAKRFEGYVAFWGEVSVED